MKGSAETSEKTDAFELPPLILHPFSNTEETSLLLESSGAMLAISVFVYLLRTGA